MLCGEIKQKHRQRIKTISPQPNAPRLSLDFEFQDQVDPHLFSEHCGGVFEQLARYTMRYQESDLHLAFILHNLLTTSAYSTSTLLFLLFSINFCSSIAAVLIAKAGHVWVS